MPEQPEAAEVETTEPAAETPKQQDPKPTETVEFWKEKARFQEDRAKENAAAAKELESIKESQKSEQQKLLERAENAEKERDAERALRQIDEWKAQVVKNPKYAGVTADVLRGTTLDEIESHAASLKALLPEPRNPGYVGTEGRPVTPGVGDKRQQFASFMRQQLNNA